MIVRWFERAKVWALSEIIGSDEQIRYWWYHFIYVPIVSLWQDYKYRDAPPVPSVPCQISGKTGHKMKDCPNAWKMGFSGYFSQQLLLKNVWSFVHDMRMFCEPPG
jgi:hypothetical protein